VEQHGHSALRPPLTWEKLADGRLWRLKRGRQFRGDVRLVTAEAVQVAHDTGRGVRVVRDELGKHQYLWLQFADQAIPLGAPCRCGSRRILRTHEHFGRCPACGATCIFRGTVAAVAPIAAAKHPNQDLRKFEDVELRCYHRGPDRERFCGHGVSPTGKLVLLLVDYPLGVDGERIDDPLRPGDPLYKLSVWPVAPFGSAIDLSLLWADGHEVEAEDGAAALPPGPT
jgi:hypothetical protein